MKQFSKETQAIIDAHKNDFNCTNYKSKLASYGGYSEYLKKWASRYLIYSPIFFIYIQER